VSYEVVCNCGQTIQGERQARHQVLTCPGCGDKVFVLPLSPLADPLHAPPAGARAPRRWWRAPLLAGLASLAGLLLVFMAVRPWLTRSHGSSGPPGTDEASLKQRIEDGRHLLAQGNFRLARRVLGEAIALRDARPRMLSPAGSRHLNQLHRQADLLARLLPVSLAEIVREGQLVRDPDEWDLQMDDYRGRGVLFDDVVRRDGQGRAVLGSYVVEVGDERVRLALEELTLLNDLPLDDEPRMLFGARLRSCEREEAGWVVRFEPDSGVLLTDLDAVAACFPVPPDKALEQVLLRQQRWLNEQAVVQPAGP
jgi:hypothetical protein